VIEIGAGTGIATEPLVRRGLSVTAIEPSPEMAALARRKLGGRGSIFVGRFEDFPEPTLVELVAAFNSWHWVDPLPGLREVARVLKAGGSLAALWGGPDPDSPFMAEARTLLGRAAGASGEGAAQALRELSDVNRAGNVLEIPAGTPFAPPEHEVFRWDMALTADELVGLLGTMSWVILLETDQREALVQLARRLLRDALGIEGDVTVDVPFRCDGYRSHLLT